MPTKLRSASLVVFSLTWPAGAAAAELVDLTPEEDLFLSLKQQKQLVQDANTVLNGLKNLALHREAAEILLGIEQGDTALVRALSLVDLEDPALQAHPPALSIADADTPSPQATVISAPAAMPKRQSIEPLKVAGAWLSNDSDTKTKAIFVGNKKYHIVYLGESFEHGGKSYRLTSVRATGTVEGGQSQFEIAIVNDRSGRTERRLWPEGE